MYADCQSILHTFILTEVDACALKCGHIVSNVRVAKVEMRRRLHVVGEGSQCTCASAALHVVIYGGDFSQTHWTNDAHNRFIHDV